MGPGRLILRPAALALAFLTAAACGGGNGGGRLPDDALVLVVSSDLAVGRERVLVSALDGDNRPLVSDQPIRLVFFDPDGAAGEEKPARFIWAVPEVRGLWAAEADFDRPGVWSAAVRTPDGRLIRGAPFSVAAAPRTAAVGGKAPPSRSKTLTDGPLESMTSDPDPDPRLYGMTVAEAVGSGRPSVIVFSTPAFCVSRTCGPVLNAAKALIDRYPNVNWVHVEVYDNLDAADAESLTPAAPVSEWGLPNEPWVFLVDEDGTVTHRFEGAVDAAELEEALARIAGGQPIIPASSGNPAASAVWQTGL